MTSWRGLVLAGIGAAAVGGCTRQQLPPVVEKAEPPKEASVAAAPPPAPAPAVAPQPARDEVDLQALLRGTVIHFEFDRDALTTESQARLKKLAEALRAKADVKIRVAGNCDERGTEEYNLALGQRRAEAAKKYLRALGVEEARVETVSFGHERPIDSSHSDEAWAANRRDEFSPR